MRDVDRLISGHTKRLTVADIQKFIPISRYSLFKYIDSGKFPKPICTENCSKKVGYYYWNTKDITKWLKEEINNPNRKETKHFPTNILKKMLRVLTVTPYSKIPVC